MLTSIVALAAIGGLDNEHSAASQALVQGMERKYADALTVSGTIIGGHSAGTGHITTTTVLKFVRPNLIYLTQTKSSNQKFTYQIASDGTVFSYDSPLVSWRPSKRLFEDVRRNNGYLMNVGDIYFAGYRGLPDPNPVFDLVLGVPNNISDWHHHLITWLPPETKGLNGLTCKVVEGDYRPTLAGPKGGRYEIWIGPDGTLARYVEVEFLNDITPGMPILKANVAAVYDVHLDLKANLSPKDFKGLN